ncbi:MAG: SGNH/GDSL hydrolase family protein [Planctomycetes bacterium]|nr:SGNH/GDSL hydrolase family protein [Planctomycetota bacterium]
MIRSSAIATSIGLSLLASIGWSVVSAADVTFTSIGMDTDTFEDHTGLWFRPDLGSAAEAEQNATRVWATKESVTGGVALKCVFEKGSKAKLSLEKAEYLPGSAGITFYAKASRPIKAIVNNVTADIGTDWTKVDFAWDKLGTTADKPNLGWQFVLAFQGPIEERTWVVIDRLGVESPTFDPAPKLEPQAGPDQSISSNDLAYGGEFLAKTVARLTAKQPFKIVALGDSVTAGAQIQRGSWGISKPEEKVSMLYFARLARLLEQHFGFQGITPVQFGHGGWTAKQGLGVIDAEVLATAGADDLVILEFGANDMGWAKVSPADWKAGMKLLIDRAKTKTDQILVLSPTVGVGIPAQAGDISTMLKQLALEEHVAAVDITKLSMYRGEPFAWAWLANHYHPDILGHLTMAEMIAPVLTGVARTYPE